MVGIHNCVLTTRIRKAVLTSAGKGMVWGMARVIPGHVISKSSASHLYIFTPKKLQKKTKTCWGFFRATIFNLVTTQQLPHTMNT